MAPGARPRAPGPGLTLGQDSPHPQPQLAQLHRLPHEVSLVAAGSAAQRARACQEVQRRLQQRHGCGPAAGAGAGSSESSCVRVRSATAGPELHHLPPRRRDVGPRGRVAARKNAGASVAPSRAGARAQIPGRGSRLRGAGGLVTSFRPPCFGRPADPSADGRLSGVAPGPVSNRSPRGRVCRGHLSGCSGLRWPQPPAGSGVGSGSLDRSSRATCSLAAQPATPLATC